MTTHFPGPESARRIAAHFAEAEPRRPPFNLEAEQALLGAILINNEAHHRVSQFLEAHHFYDPLHKQIYETAVKLIGSGKQATPITLRTFFENAEPVDATLTAPQYLGKLAANAATTINARDYGRTVYDLAIRRHLILISEDMANAAYDAPVDFPPEEQLAEAQERITSLRSTALSASGDADLVFLNEVEDEPDRPDIIEGMISAASVGAIYGEWSVGKTFFSIYGMFCVALGHKCLGREVDRGSVLYVPYEGVSRIGRRLKAAKEAYGDPGYAFSYLRKPGSIRTKADADLFVQQVIKAATRLVERSGLPLRLVVIDTLAAAMAGANENDAETMALALRAGEAIARETGAAVVYVAHPGKDKAKKLRGSYALPAGLTDLILIEKPSDENVRTVIQEKARDGEQGPRGAYALRAVTLGQDARGRDITTCVVDAEVSALAGSRKPAAPAPSSQSGMALNELDHLLIAGRYTVSRGHDRIPNGAKLVATKDWREACRKKQLSKDGEALAERKAFDRAKRDIQGGDLIGDYEGFVWRVGHEHFQPTNAPNR